MISLPPVCILTAGKGSRMGNMSTYLNKSLFQINGKANISHIINRFDNKTKFIIAIGHLGDQVKNYLEIAHPKIQFEFVKVPNFDDEGSGPGLSLLSCKKNLSEPFYFVSCDTLWEKNSEINYISQNWLGVSSIKSEDTDKYCNLKISDDYIIKIKDKKKTENKSYKAFIGLGFIKDYKNFFLGLERKDKIFEEHQISNGLEFLISQNKVKPLDFNWTDVGTREHYEEVLKKYENYDFSKHDETLYFVNKKVIKFFKDKNIITNRVLRSKINKKVFPVIIDHKEQFYSYNYVEGHTLYMNNNIDIFQKLLDFLDSNLWKTQQNVNNFKELCHKFYFQKTYERLKKYHTKYPQSDVENIINGKLINSVSTLLSKIDWDKIINGIPVFFHGDLQFDNIIYNNNKKEFTLLDWRQDFAGNIDAGDIYYDLSKLYGGMILNYDLIKLNMFKYEEINNKIYYDFVQRYSNRNFIEIFKSYLVKKNLKFSKVEILVALIFLNMAPLHHNPFDKLLYALGRTMLNKILK